MIIGFQGGLVFQDFNENFFCTPPTKNSRRVRGELFLNNLPIGGLSKILLLLGWRNGAIDDQDEQIEGWAFLAFHIFEHIDLAF